MKSWRCAVCNKAVTEKGLSEGRGKAVDRKVYCSEHMPGRAKGFSPAGGDFQSKTVESAEKDKKEPLHTRRHIAPGRGSKRLSAVQGKQAKSGKKKILIALAALFIIAVIAGVPFFLYKSGFIIIITRAGPEDIQKGEQESEKESVEKDEVIEERVDEKEAEQTDKEEVIDIAEEFDQIVKEANGDFDGTVEGFRKAEKLLHSRILGAEHYKDTDYIEQTWKIMEEKGEEINKKIKQEFYQVQDKVYALMNDLLHKEALKVLEEFPKDYRTFDVWGSRYQRLDDDIKKIADSQFQTWIKDAEEKLEAGQKKNALSFLKEVHEVVDGIVFDEITEKLLRTIQGIETGVKPTEVEGNVSSAAVLELAEFYFNTGNIADAEAEYQKILNFFSGDPDVIENRAGIEKRAAKINRMKEEGKDKEVKILFFDNFEKVLTMRKGSRFWKFSTYQRVRTFRNSEMAVQSILMTEESSAAAAAEISGAVPPGMALFAYENNTSFSFWYFIETEQDTVKGDVLRIRCRDFTMSDNYYYRVQHPEKNKWAFCSVMMDTWLSEGPWGLEPQKNDIFTSISFLYGDFGDEVVFYIDDLAVVSGSTLYYIKDKVAEKAEMIDNITADLRKDFYRMDIEVLENVASMSSKDCDKDVILLVGGIHVQPAFVSAVKNKTGKRIIKINGTGTKRVTSDGIVKNLGALIKKEKPGMVLYVIGMNDIMNGLDIEKFYKKIRTLVDLSIENGAVPVLFTVPASFEEEYKKKIIRVNRDIMDVAKMYYIPIVDVYRIFSFSDEPLQYYSNKVILKKSGYEAVAEKFSNIFEAVDNYIFQKTIQDK